MNNIGTTPKVLGLDISTKTIGWALFDNFEQRLLELNHRLGTICYTKKTTFRINTLLPKSKT